MPEMAAYLRSAMNLSDDQALRVEISGAFVANAFSVLRQPPLLGRNFTAAEGEPDAQGARAFVG